MSKDKLREKIADKIFLSGQKFVCLDVCSECCNFGADGECEHENAVGKWEDMIECPQDRLVANTLADQITALFPDIEGLEKQIRQLKQSDFAEIPYASKLRKVQLDGGQFVYEKVLRLIRKMEGEK